MKILRVFPRDYKVFKYFNLETWKYFQISDLVINELPELKYTILFYDGEVDNWFIYRSREERDNSLNEILKFLKSNDNYGEGFECDKYKTDMMRTTSLLDRIWDSIVDLKNSQDTNY